MVIQGDQWMQKSRQSYGGDDRFTILNFNIKKSKRTRWQINSSLKLAKCCNRRVGGIQILSRSGRYFVQQIGDNAIILEIATLHQFFLTAA